ncbi:DUF4221 family protein [Algoriphagus sp. D3-2-R+10]|nr:DUF4221 family protein [Algoriphagus sp. D3-2-R+10]
MSSDSAWIKDGDILDTEGPYGVGNVFSFFTTKDHIVFMNSQQFFNQHRQTREVSMKFMHEYGIFGEEEFTAISVPLFKNVSHEFNGIDINSGVGYFVYDNDKKIRVVGYDSKLDSMYFLPVSLDSINYFLLRFKVRANNLIMGGNDEPQLSVVGNRLLVSYPSFSDILVYNLESENYQVFTSTSNSFPSKKTLPQNYADEVDSFELLDELEKSWRGQVRYGPMIFLKDLNKFVRLVKGEGGKDSNYFLEVFDVDFQKIEEFNLTGLNPDLSPNYLNTKYGLMFRAKDQPGEDVMYYYYVNLTDSK